MTTTPTTPSTPATPSAADQKPAGALRWLAKFLLFLALFGVLAGLIGYVLLGNERDTAQPAVPPAAAPPAAPAEVKQAEAPALPQTTPVAEH